MDEKIKINEIILENEMGSPVQLFKNGENLIPNLTNLMVRQCDGLRFLLSYSMARSLVKLKHLEVHNCQIMEEIVSLEEYLEENTDNIFCKLSHLQLLHLPQLTRFCIGSYIEFPSLEILHVEDCTKLETFVLDPVLIQNEETHSSNSHQNPTPYFLFDEKVGFPSLKGVVIYDLPKLITIWHNQLSQDSFCRLSKVDVRRCQSLKNIFPVSVAKGLKQLRILYVQARLHGIGCGCNGVETIVAKEEGQEMELNFVFPKATSVTFNMLPQIKCFYNGRHTSRWPLLHQLCVSACPNVALFVSEISRVRKANASTEPFFIIEKNSFPNLDHLILGGTRLEIWDGPLPADFFAKVKILNVASQRFKLSPDSLQKFHSLESLIVMGTPLEEIFVNHGSSSGTIHAVGTQLRRVRSLKLSRMSMLLHLGVENSQPVVFPNLEILEVELCVRLQNLRASAISFQNLITLKILLWKLFGQTPNLGEISRYRLPGEFYPERFLQNFNNLENLVLHGDHKEIFFHEENSTGELRTVVSLPHLKSLKFSEMHMLVHLGKEISSQPIIPNLEVLEVSLCEKLQNLSSPAVSFQNLTTLKVFGCHGLEYLITSSIALTLVQLTHLEVKNCERLMEIVGSSREDMAGNEIIAFNKLQHLKLSGLPSLQCFFSGNCISHTTICKEIEERECTETVVPCFLFNGKVGFPSLEILMIHDLPKLMTIWHGQFAPDSFCKLKRIFVQGCHSLIKIFGATILERMNALETLLLKQCKLLQLVFELGGITAQETDDTSFTPSKLPEFSQNLVSVEIESCDSLSYIFPASVAKRLPQLRRLSVGNCERVEEIVAMEGVDMTTPVFVFPNAISVRLLGLPRLLGPLLCGLYSST
ncbi:uncharacterized protein LOC126787298 [Argentina anserina]|uniref:uncharacterized protein LOC126787298 n=1 Tax=Argentina anserina TaxID=57926 RepID=UPI002176683E|nr:uncharacterized protein LOC126787298 [Potentilla anserina]